LLQLPGASRLDRGVVASNTRTRRCCASPRGHAAALDGALSLFEDYVQRGDSAAVLFYLRSLSDSNFGHCAVAMIALALLRDAQAAGA
jgi:hypothetical protein